MRIAILVGHFPPGAFGGAEAQAQEWAVRLARRHEVTVVTRRDAPAQPRTERRDGFVVLRTPVSAVPLWRTADNLRAIGAAVRGLPRRPDVLLCFQTFVSGLAGVLVSRRLGVPAVVWVRGEREYRFGESRTSRVVSTRVWERARGVLVQSDSTRDALLAEVRCRRPGAAPGVAAKLRVVPNGIAVPARPGPGAAPRDRGTSVLVLGRLVASKRVDVVVEAVAGLRGVELVVAGAGPERPALVELAARRGVAASFVGFVAPERVPGLLASADCLVLASSGGEGTPNAVLEAMAHGVPVVATRVAGVPDIVRDATSGLLVEPGDPAALRAALGRLLGDRELRDRLVAGGHEVARRHDWARVEPMLESALAEWCAAGRGA